MKNKLRRRLRIGNLREKMLNYGCVLMVAAIISFFIQGAPAKAAGIVFMIGLSSVFSSAIHFKRTGDNYDYD